jgi:hypothetical protein
MTDLSGFTPSDLRRCVRTLARNALHRAARWFLTFCLLEAVWIAWLLLS